MSGIRALLAFSIAVFSSVSLNAKTPSITAFVTSTNATCYGTPDGSITVNSASGGSGTYEYSKDGGTTWQVSNFFVSLSSGAYDVRIRDAANHADVVALGTTIISQPVALGATISKTSESMAGANDGTITISSAYGGYGTYEYSINSGVSWQSSGSFTGLSAATYDVQIRDKAHTSCVKDLDGASNTTVSQLAPLSASVTSTDITCNGVNNGTITISSATGGHGTYEYSKDGGTTWQSSASFTSLAPASTYNVWIRDAFYTPNAIDLDGVSNTTINSSITAMTASYSTQNITCKGASEGSVTFSSPSGGSGTYQYTINGGSTWQSSGSFTNLVASTYNLRIRDAAYTSCVVDMDGSTNTPITQPNALTATKAVTNITMNGANDGTITLSSPAGGFGTYEYSINGGTTWQASGSFTGLANATYNVQIRDAAHTSCIVDLDGSTNTTITQPAPLSAVVTITDITCNNANDGTIIISSATGGYGTYEYSIDGGTVWQSSGSFTGLAPASYNVWIRDAAHTANMVDVDGGSNTPLPQPAALTATITTQNVSCNGANDGLISFNTPAGGSGTYQYTINGGSTWQSSMSFTNLAASTYNLRIRDAAHTTCVVDLDASANTTINQPNALAATVGSTNVTVNGANDGTITISSPAGGNGTYEYSIDGGSAWQSSGSFTNLANATYDVFIRDAANTQCVIDLDGSANTIITQPAAVISAIVTSTMVTCYGANDGTITISSATGGSGTFEYSILSSWQSSGSFTGLTPGIYYVQIRDAADHSNVVDLDGWGNTWIVSPGLLTANINLTNVSCNGANDGTITISSPSGGFLGPYEYSLNGGATWQSSVSFIGLAASSTYNLQMRDAAHAGCVADLDGSANTSITQPDVLTATVAVTNVTVNGANDGTIAISAAAGGSGPYEFSIDGGTTWQPSGSFTGLANATYNTLIRDAVGCSIDLDGTTNTTITQPDKITAIEQAGEWDVKLYPNPTTDKLILILGEPEETVEVVIVNSLGQLVKQVPILQNGSEISLSGMPSGVYNVIVDNSKGQRVVQKIIKK